MPRRINITFFLIFLISGIYHPLFSQDNLVQDLRDEWLVYEQEEKILVPLTENLVDQSFFHLNLELTKFQDYHLLVELPSGASLFIENRIVFVAKVERDALLKIDSLRGIYGDDDLLISIFYPKAMLDKINTLIVDKNSKLLRNANASTFNIKVRNRNTNNNFFVIGVIIILAVVVFVKQVLKSSFFDYLSPSKTFSIKPKSEILYSIGFFSLSNMLMLFLYGISSGFILIMAVVLLRQGVIAGLKLETTLELIGASLGLALLVIFFMIIRNFQLRLIGGIYKMKSSINIQFYDYFRISLFILLAFFTLLVFNFGAIDPFMVSHETTFKGLFISALFLRTVFIYMKLNNVSSNKNLHLFSYICGTELIQLIIVVKVFLN